MRKVNRIVCLLLFSGLSISISWAQEWSMDARTLEAYEKVLNLHPAEAIALIPEPTTAQEYYVVSLAKTIELLLTEDAELYQTYGDHHEDLHGMRSKSSLAEDLFLQAEIRMQWVFVYLKFGHEIDAAWSLRQAYLNMEDCRSRFPDFEPIRKTAGLLHIIIGTVPEKYKWVLSLMSMQGDVDTGLAELDQVRKADHLLALESKILYALVQGFVIQQPDKGMAELEALLVRYPNNRLVHYIGASLALKNAQSERALQLLEKLETLEKETPFAYAYYLKGEALLNKGEYMRAVGAYRFFLNHYAGKNYIKDAHYKIGLCYLLNGNGSDAESMFKVARSQGQEETEADKYAARSLEEEELPNIPLTRIRHLTDGGFYPQARQLLDSIRSPEIPTHRDHVEYYYRKARLAHKMNEIPVAVENYKNTIDTNGEEGQWYYAPNACLQLGYIYMDQKQYDLARDHFERAMRYRNHEYKNSIDGKAKAALDHIKRLR